MSLEQNFNAAADKMKALTKRPTDAELLEVYALFKQGSVGDNNTSKPGMLDLKGKAKWNAWNDKKGLAQDKAKADYIELANELQIRYA